jgi:hypothetical protein
VTPTAAGLERAGGTLQPETRNYNGCGSVEMPITLDAFGIRESD